MLNDIRHYDGHPFVLAEQIGNYRDAALAQAEYWAEGMCCRKEPVVSRKKGRPYHGLYYNLWVGPRRKVRVRTLPGENIRREGKRAAAVRKISAEFSERITEEEE